jgi:Flp pilus assembly protein TadB
MGNKKEKVMSKITNKLLPEDFGKSFDEEVFNNWKKSINEHEQASVITMVLFFSGLASILLLGGLVGIGLFFVLAFIGLGTTLPKLSKRKEYQRQLSISMKELRDAVLAAKKRV